MNATCKLALASILAISCAMSAAAINSSVSQDQATRTTESQPAKDSPQLSLYKQHCAACHGADGNGIGLGARHVFPKPRDFRAGRYRLVSTVNRVANRDDLKRTIRNGIPGTSMRAFPKLPDQDVDQIIDLILQFRKEQAEADIRKTAAARGIVDETKIAEELKQVTTPDKILAVPAIEQSAELLEQGRTLFKKLNCVACHGEGGEGILGVALADDKGFATRAPSLVWEKLKSGRDYKAIYHRIRLGLPGTPMPGSPTLKLEEVAALTHYCLSVGKDPKRNYTNHQRARMAIGAKFDD